MQKRNSKLFLEIFLGLLSGFGPFVMDMYLSALPEITQFYEKSPSMVQLSLAVCTIGLALGQLVFGTLSDRYGRKTPLMASLLVYLLTSVACVFSPTVWLFIVARFLQGLSAAGGVVISRSIAADCYSGNALARMYGIIGMINGVATVVAPMFGGFVIQSFGWKAVFWLLFAVGAVMILFGLRFYESLACEDRHPINPRALKQGAIKIAHNSLFTGAVTQYGLIMALIFVNLASAPFIMNDYGMNAEQISITFGVNAIALGIAAGVAARFRDMRVVVRGSNIGVFVSTIPLAFCLIFNFGFWPYEICIFVMYLFVGAMCTAVATLSMDSERENAGIASAIYGAVGYAAGGITSPLVGLGCIPVTSAIMFAGIALIALLLNIGNRALRPQKA